MVLAGLLPLAATVSAQQAEQFKVATLNIDGLPQKILVINVNADGPGAEGTSRIGKYLMKKGYDIVCMQEDFNYHGVLTPWLEDNYLFDEWSGAVGIDLPDKKIDFLHLQNEQFDCDGLGAFWKKGISLSSAERVAWQELFGKFSHCNDELVKKGFRRYEMTLANGISLLVYNMHMDASDDLDELEGKAGPDRAARLSEWEQLKEDVLAHLDTRPIIIMGDMNSYYWRDQVKEKFIDEINATGRGQATDVWVELANGGEYPAYIGDSAESQGYVAENDEMLDKIIYINPASGKLIKAVSFDVDKEGYTYEGKALGDHYPVAATFEIVDIEKPTGIETVGTTGTNVEYYNLNGQHVGQPAKGLYIERQEKSSRKRIIK